MNNDYPRIIRLEESADPSRHGDLLAMYSINDTGVRTHSVIKRSTDGGQTWNQVSTLYSPTPGWGIYFGSMYELPVATGGLAAGTIIAAGNAWDNANWGFQEVQTFVSTDYGVTWTQRGNCATKSGSPSAVATGLWEPEIILNADGKLACHFSDERLRSSGYYQKLVMATSSDGGATWGGQVDTVAIGDSSSRPGMPVVRKLGNGDYALAYELCRDSVGNADQTCRVYLKISADGASWGTPSSLGTLVQTGDGRQLLHTPGLAWTPAGGPDGTLIMAGQRVVTGSDGPTTVVQPESGRVVFVNTANGAGSWDAVSAPVTIDPTGDYNNGPGKHCANYSPSLLPTASGSAVMMVTPRFVSGSNTRCDVRFGIGPIGTLPLYAPFDSGNDSGWSTYGGNWSVGGGVYSQAGGSAGPKSLVGSTGWSDVTVTTDLRLDSAGQAGVLLRTTEPDVGADSHDGYYIGVESNNTLFIGKQTYGWTGLASTAVSGGVSTGAWYTLQASVVGCTITAVLKRENATATTTATATDPGCLAAGQAGVRSHLTSASFRNFQVTPAAASTATTYSDSWASGASSGWTSHGGTWSTVALSGTQQQTASGSNGPKYVSPVSGNAYTVSSDVRITSLSAPSGNGGVMARVNSPGTGPDAYLGYFAGIDGSTGQLSLGRANTGTWTPLANSSVPGGVALDTWYHVTLRATGCSISATAQRTSSWDQATVGIVDGGCPASGSTGIRGMLATTDFREYSVTRG
ncbi:family 16 glycoside hydrolase [Microcella indica]|uniref:family 16 glycoside hydrolase n=1 Tax=Microcella indica TaxID=2750620 RepID=UPI0015CF51DD|nr:family 16 glycoside hydrolase [Microcella indica]